MIGFRELCATAVAAKDPEEVNLILSELRATIRQHMQRPKHIRWRFLAVAKDFRHERRNASYK
jgi:hypothetical protein